MMLLHASRKVGRLYFLLVVSLLAATRDADAHFLWLKLIRDDNQSESRLFFSEGVHVNGDHVPDRVGEAEVWETQADGERKRLELTVPEDSEIECLSQSSVAAGSRAIATTCRYGNYHGTLLTYYARALDVRRAEDWAKLGSDPHQRLDITLRGAKEGVELAVIWDGKPVPSAQISLTNPAGDSRKLKTDETGYVQFLPRETGTYGLLTNFKEDEAEGEIDGETYRGASHYATLSVRLEAVENADAGRIEQEAARGEFPELPHAIASFGAAVLDGSLYVYGGHTGTAHAHSRDNLSNSFVRLDLKTRDAWQSLPMTQPLQGLALVGHGRFLYRIGGLDARNQAGEADDLHSVATAARFDVRSQSWQSLPDLPAGRSSHDAVIMGDKLYVVGGWELKGDDEGEWLDSMLTMDLKAPKLEWTVIDDVPFRKRALSVAAHDGEIYALCGMDATALVDRTVYIFHPESGAWREGPTLPGDGMSGFGVSAWGMEGNLYLSGHDGVLYRLSGDKTTWEPCGNLVQGRFFHRLLPLGASQLVAIGGESPTGHLRCVESIRPEPVVARGDWPPMIRAGKSDREWNE